MEHYGPVELNWGVYPEGLEYDAGGVWGEECIAPNVLAADAERAAHYKRNMEQRGSNNAYLYETSPERLRYAYGAGCMNPNCKCHNCHNSCYCKPGVRGQTALLSGAAAAAADRFGWKQIFLIVLAILLAAFIYRR